MTLAMWTGRNEAGRVTSWIAAAAAGPAPAVEDAVRLVCRAAPHSNDSEMASRQYKINKAVEQRRRIDWAGVCCVL